MTSDSCCTTPGRVTADVVERARQLGERLPAGLAAQIDDFRTDSGASGCLLLRGLPVGELPTTPSAPDGGIDKDLATERLLLAVAMRLGEPVGYLPESAGALVQNLVPVASSETRQTSTSSRVQLMFHTEAAFHPHRPRYLLLFCLRGDESATTTVSSIDRAITRLSDEQLAVLHAPRFRCAVDESYLNGRDNQLGEPMPVLIDHGSRRSMVFDQDLMVGIDIEAQDALDALGEALIARHDGVVLEAGDLMVLDNAAVVHGRSPFTPRYDGFDRWLQRAFVVEDLQASASQRSGRVITTIFGTEPGR